MKNSLSKSVAIVPLLIASPFIFTSDMKLPSAYDNTLTGMIPDLYAGMDFISRELVGFIPAVTRNLNAERAAIGEAVRGPVAPALAGKDITPAMNTPEPPDTTLGNKSITITKARAVAFGWTGEEQQGLNNGPGFLSVNADYFAQALRTLTNEVESDIADVAAVAASRAHGVAGTTPFASNLGDVAQLKKILDDNGAPASDRQLVLNTSAGAALRTLQQLNKVNEAGDASMLRQGELTNIHNFSISETNENRDHVKGTGASATTDNAGYAVGATVITLASAGTGTILAGDVVTFAGDTNKYLVASGDADVSGGGTITLVAPGLRVAIAASTTALTLGNSYAANTAFSRNALHLAARMPALPEEGDAAVDRITITDDRSGLAVDVAIYLGYHKVSYEVGLAWGVSDIKNEHIAMLLG